MYVPAGILVPVNCIYSVRFAVVGVRMPIVLTVSTPVVLKLPVDITTVLLVVTVGENPAKVIDVTG